MPKTYLEAVCRQSQSVNALFSFLGIEVQTIESNRAVLQLPFKPELIQGGGVVAGGILATLLDETMAHAVLGGNQPGQFTSTIDMTINYLRPAKMDFDLICEAHVVKRGGRIAFAEGVVLSGEQEAARATASFMLLSRKA